MKAETVDVMNDGSKGGYAVIRATGPDALNDYLNLPGVISSMIGGAALAVDPNTALPLRVTTYYVLSPSESRVRMLTAFCNDGKENVVVAMGDLFEQGGSTELFNPTGCTNGLGLASGCLVDPYPWFAFQGDGVAYGLRSYKFTDPKTPEPQSAMIGFSGVVGTLSGGKDQAGVLTWLDTAAPSRPAAFGIREAESRRYVRDLLIGRDLADLSSQLLALDNDGKGRLSVNVTNPDGTPAAAARVAVIRANDGKQQTLMITGADGKAKVDLPIGNYSLKVGQRGHAIEPAADVQLPVQGLTKDLRLGAARHLTVTVKDPFGAPLPAKITVRCPGGACPAPSLAYRPFFDVDPLPSDIQTLAFTGANGVADVLVPPGVYEVLISRGPEYNGWPDTFPMAGRMVDLTAADQAVPDAVLARVVDTDGWLSADLHVHAVNSADSSVPNRQRVLTFAAEGVDVLAATDHDVVTDYAPYVAELGLGAHVSTMIGCEVSTFDFGHQNVYPISKADTPNGGAFDWAGGDGATLRLDQIYAGLRTAYPGAVVQLNHARGGLGALTQLKADTRSGATHADPATFRMEANPAATAADTKLMTEDFDAMEVHNSATPSIALMNDWMTYLSRGKLKAATAVSDSHSVHGETIGYGRTWVKLGAYSPAAFAESLAARHAVGGNGPFIRLTARKLDAANVPVGSSVDVGDTLSISPTANEKVELTVDVQAPEWMTFDRVEVYTHAAGREASNGASNDTPPAAVETRMLDSTMLPVEAVPMMNGLNVRRIHVVERFTFSPTADTWFAVFVRGTTAVRPLFPLLVGGVSCNSSGACTSGPRYPWSFTNAVLVDADGSGSYDDFPLKGQGLSAPIKNEKPPYRVPSLEEVLGMIRTLKEHRHE
ncbi:MAG: PHP domain-containing protein [Myxococcaceae bacterium]|nr:PHP domain-containing protein [Myxococcaceae bacterium]